MLVVLRVHPSMCWHRHLPCRPRYNRYNASQYGAGLMLVVGICLFTAGDAEGLPNFHPAGIALISLALVGGWHGVAGGGSRRRKRGREGQ